MGNTPIVYIVEDDEPLRDSLEKLIRSAGLEVLAFGSPSEFRSQYDTSRPGCLILDLRLPEMSGLELYQRLSTRGYCHPFIIITGYGEVSFAVEALQLGALDFLEKPFSHQRLLDRVHEAIHQDVEARRRFDEMKRLQSRIDSLTPRERDVLQRVVAGKLTKEIAKDLGISLKTVEVHRSKVKKKLQVDSVAQLMLLMVSYMRHEQEATARGFERTGVPLGEPFAETLFGGLTTPRS